MSAATTGDSGTEMMCECGNKPVHAWEPGEWCSPERVVPGGGSGEAAKGIEPCPHCRSTRKLPLPSTGKPRFQDCPYCSGEATVTVKLTRDELQALCHELSEPYGHEIRGGILGKLRAALNSEQNK